MRSPNSCAPLVEVKNGAAIVENSVEVSQKIKLELPFDPVIPLLGTYPKELKSGSQSDMCTHMFTATLFTTAKTWKH